MRGLMVRVLGLLWQIISCKQTNKNEINPKSLDSTIFLFVEWVSLIIARNGEDKGQGSPLVGVS